MPKIKLGFDISQIAHVGGVANYTENLALELLKISDLEIIFFYSSLRKRYKGDIKKVKSFHLPPTIFEVLFNRIRNVGIEKFIGNVDIFHSSDWVQPPTKAKKVTTYHDLAPIIYPEWSNPKIVDVQKRRLQIVKKEVDRIIAVSEATKKDLIDIAQIPEEKIYVIYEAADKVFKKYDENDVAEFRKKLNLPEKFILAISGVGERRNLKIIKKICKNLNLIIAGETLPHLSKKEMALLYNSAEILLYPSFYEGFGLPIIEAFACGLPVITSNISSMPEIAGDAALLVDPNNHKDIEKNVNSLMNDSALKAELIKKGFARAKMFSWEKAAKETYEIYKKLLE